jgi:hypothetical protein
MAIVLNGTTGITNDGGYTGDGVVFADTTPADTLVTTTGGNVGIGTSSPGTKFDVRAGSVVQTIYNTDATSNDSHNATIRAYAASTSYWNKLVLDGSQLILNSYGAERARIDSSGNLLVGTTSDVSGAADGIQLRAGNGNTKFSVNNTGNNVQIYFYNGNGIVGSINTNGSATSYVTSSDYRLKENVQPMTGALSRVAALKPVTYKWKIDGSDGEGFIAHELQSVVPECVTGEKDAVDAEGNPQYQGIDTSFLVATLTAAIQELKAIVDAQGAEITALKGTQP